jgi:hypothetical protein
MNELFPVVFALIIILSNDFRQMEPLINITAIFETGIKIYPQYWFLSLILQSLKSTGLTSIFYVLDMKPSQKSLFAQSARGGQVSVLGARFKSSTYLSSA